ncbi:MAG: hypothetical protein ACOY93_22030 [Bacillota bacterium]
MRILPGSRSVTTRLSLAGAALLLLALAAGCSTPATPPALAPDPEPAPADQAPSPGPSAAPAGVADGPKEVAAALGLTPEQVLDQAPFQGGRLGDQPFAGGWVLLWRSEPDRLTAQAALERPEGGWRATNVTAHLITPTGQPLLATAALLNDVSEAERKVPLWAFFGQVQDPRIRSVAINFPGMPTLHAQVKPNATWLLLHQGLIHTGPPHEGEIVASDAQFREIARQRITLP